MATSPQKTPVVQVVAKDFKQTAAASGLARKLFDPSENFKLSPALITQILTAAGLNVPKEVKITADVAQILLSGGAIVSNVERGADIGAFIQPSALGIKAVTDILSLCGLMNPKDPAAQLLNVGLDLALVVSSGGLNIFADLALVMDLIGAIFSSLPDRTQEYTDYAHYLNKKSYYDWMTKRTALEQTAASLNFQKYQQGQIDCFEFIGEIAQDAPDLFLNFFPEMGFFFPPYTASQCFTSRVQKHDTGGFFGLQSKDYDIVKEDCFNFVTIQNRRSDIQNGIFKKFVEEPARIFYEIQKQASGVYRGVSFFDPAQAYPKELGLTPHKTPCIRMDIKDMAVLSMFPPYFKNLKPGFDVRPILRALGLTPSDFGYRVVEDELTMGDYAAIQPVRPTSGISINGVDQIPPSLQSIYQANENKYLANYKEAQDAIYADESGNINRLLSFKAASSVIAEWGVPIIPAYDGEDPRRNIQNLWSAVSIVNQLKKDKIFQNLGSKDEPVSVVLNAGRQADVSEMLGSNNLQKLLNQGNKGSSPSQPASSPLLGFDFENRSDNLIGTPDWYDARYRELQFKIVGRKMNQQARKRIAGYYGVDPSRVQFRKAQPGQLAAVRIV